MMEDTMKNRLLTAKRGALIAMVGAAALLSIPQQAAAETCRDNNQASAGFNELFECNAIGGGAGVGDGNRAGVIVDAPGIAAPKGGGGGGNAGNAGGGDPPAPAGGGDMAGGGGADAPAPAEGGDMGGGDDMAGGGGGAADCSLPAGLATISIDDSSLPVLNVREGPSLKAKIRAQIPDGEEVTVAGSCGLPKGAGLAANKGGTTPGRWCKISAPAQGCVMQQFLVAGGGGGLPKGAGIAAD
jgi:hypothetical protein